VRNGFVSVTPIKVDLTRHESVGLVAQWLAQ
jgi:broad specificity polyphosphatase/5'/3'-nucleotidase SurE